MIFSILIENSGTFPFCRILQPTTLMIFLQLDVMNLFSTSIWYNS